MKVREEEEEEKEEAGRERDGMVGRRRDRPGRGPCPRGTGRGWCPRSTDLLCCRTSPPTRSPEPVHTRTSRREREYNTLSHVHTGTCTLLQVHSTIDVHVYTYRGCTDSIFLSRGGCTDSIFLNHKRCVHSIFLSRRGCTDYIFLSR